MRLILTGEGTKTGQQVGTEMVGPLWKEQSARKVSPSVIPKPQEPWSPSCHTAEMDGRKSGGE